MANSFVIPDMVAAILDRQFPAITCLQRVEGRPRARKFDDALKAEVRDALWMLSRQWQMGEFEGDDAASPFFAKMNLRTAPLTKYRADAQPAEKFDTEIPLEAKVERQPVPLSHKGRPFGLDIRLLMGRQWMKLLGDRPAYAQAFRAKYPIDMPAADDADARAHPGVLQAFAAAAGRRMDGGKLLEYLAGDPGRHVYDGLTVAESDKGLLDERGQRWVAWFERLFCQPRPSTNQAWDPSRLEYQCACSAPAENGEKTFVADEYYQGRLDWYNFNIGPAGLGGPADVLPPAQTSTVIPTPVEFPGMPNTRWWEFEDRKTNLGDVTAATTDLAKLLFLEFGLVYANDWFLIPATIPAGSIANVRGLVVTNVFGEHVWIEPAGSGVDNQWQKWGMFTINRKGSIDENVDPTLLVLPTLPTYLESNPVEEVLFFRDETANMVWAVEKTVQSPDGVSRPGAETASEVRTFYRRELGDGLKRTTPTKYNAAVRYRAMNSVPENWVPFIPTHVANDNRQIQLRRARMPRDFEGDVDPTKVNLLPEEQRLVLPQTTLLSHGLASQPRQPYFVHEEEVPRSGTRLTLTFQRARWKNGRVLIWLGLRKQVGRGEGSSGLAFDQIIDVPEAERM